jgi:CRP/FNR family transcriptional regulator, cyclic AMP receptor protein
MAILGRDGNTHSFDDDPLLYLPCSTILEYGRSEIIYTDEDPCTDIYVVITGMVRVSRLAEHGQKVIVDIYSTDEFFGEAALVQSRRGEQAMALEKTMLMAWKSADVEELAERRPGLALALVKMMVRREIEFGDRLQSLLLDSIAVSLAKSLLRLSDRLGTPGENGFVRMRSFTHEFLAQYVGTSRELVNTCMNQFRRRNLLRYSRREIAVCRDRLIEWIRTHSREGIDLTA